MHNSRCALTFVVIVATVLYSGDPSEGSCLRNRESVTQQTRLVHLCGLLPRDQVPDRAARKTVLTLDFFRCKELRVQKRHLSLVGIRGGMEGGNEDNVGWGNVDMNAADDELDLGAQAAEQAWPEQVLIVGCRAKYSLNEFHAHPKN